MSTSSSAPGETRLALAAGVGCYLIWGLVPLVFQTIGHLGVSPWEILTNRCLWAIPVALLFVMLARQGAHLREVFRSPGVLGGLLLSSVLIASNWSVYIWAVNSGHVLESSLGYYITPLVMMAAGALLFKERIDRTGAVAIALAAVGVAVQALALGRLPWVSVALGVSFAGYGVVRKRVAAEAQTGFLVECLMLAAPALAYALWLHGQGADHVTKGGAATVWLVACGPITALPLVLFAWAARRIPMTVVGFLQFISPTLGFAIGVLEGEAFTPLRALSFAFIWGGAAIFLGGAVQKARTARLALAQSAA